MTRILAWTPPHAVCLQWWGWSIASRDWRLDFEHHFAWLVRRGRASCSNNAMRHTASTLVIRLWVSLQQINDKNQPRDLSITIPVKDLYSQSIRFLLHGCNAFSWGFLYSLPPLYQSSSLLFTQTHSLFCSCCVLDPNSIQAKQSQWVKTSKVTHVHVLACLAQTPLRRRSTYPTPVRRPANAVCGTVCMGIVFDWWTKTLSY